VTFVSVSHRSLLNGDDEPKLLPYAITPICPIGADGGHQAPGGLLARPGRGGGAAAWVSP